MSTTKNADSLSEHYSALQLRTDRWSALKALAADLARSKSSTQKEKLVARNKQLLTLLEQIEAYWGYPGPRILQQLRQSLSGAEYADYSRLVAQVVRNLISGHYRCDAIERHTEKNANDVSLRKSDKPYFEVLIVDSLASEHAQAQRAALYDVKRLNDDFVYETVVVPSFEDALIAVLFNYNIQSVVVRYDFDLQASHDLGMLRRYIKNLNTDAEIPRDEYGPELCRVLQRLRPELDVFLVTDRPVEDVATMELGNCRRIFYNQEDYIELHLNILRSLSSRYNTPFFNALKSYAQRPTGVFHAMPISRGKSITRSNWIRDMGEFYGMNIFLAETSATSGGLDSLLEPHGPIKKAQELAARAFGAKQTYFATNGTSTCNKIVVQAIVRPGDIVLVDRDCHKSHHYGMVLSGARVVYLDSYPLNEYSMYGAVPLREIKHKLLELKRANKLDQVRMLLLTNCTFDGVVYNVERVMEECLAIKPDLVFLWDEAWFAFARFSPAYRQRTAMAAAETLREKWRSPAYRDMYARHKADLAEADEETLLNTRLYPDPDQARVRVYATHSTHKTLTALRQGSMIHVHDQSFKGEVEQAFHEAYMTHTSTSPNYQIIASLDVGRRQVELEGFALVQKQIEAAMMIRKAVVTHPVLKKYFKVLTVRDMIPEPYRESGIESYFDSEHGWSEDWETAWESDEFTLDATRVTLAVGATGMDGDTFKNSELMDKYGIQINKTSRNTVLFMTNIGTTRSSVAYLISVLHQIAKKIDADLEDASLMEARAFNRRVLSLTRELPPLPDFSRFHSLFCSDDGRDTPEGDIRRAYFLAYNEGLCEYFPLLDDSMDKAIANGRVLVSASFVIPYPPGFPILVPGQVVSMDILTFMRALDVSEIHGYRPELGLRVFTQVALSDARPSQGSNKIMQRLSGEEINP